MAQLAYKVFIDEDFLAAFEDFINAHQPHMDFEFIDLVQEP